MLRLREGRMKAVNKRARPVAKRLLPREQNAARLAAARFFNRTFYYLKAEQFIEASTRLLSEPV